MARERAHADENEEGNSTAEEDILLARMTEVRQKHYRVHKHSRSTKTTGTLLQAR